ncbi:hypothetical protein BGU94_03460, partial [Clostridioides difficile]
MELFIEVIKFNIYISPLILFFILFTKKISKYTFKFNYFICLLIALSYHNLTLPQIREGYEKVGPRLLTTSRTTQHE